MKKHTWELLRRLHYDSSLPWVCGGDFNEVLAPHEKLGDEFDAWMPWQNLGRIFVTAI